MSADEFVQLKQRLNRIEIESAKAEERKKQAQERVRTATARLKELGLSPKTAKADVERLYQECVAGIEELEELLGLR